jgi:hypothetical protein
LLKDQQQLSTSHFGSILPGTIDYTYHHDSIRNILKAMDQKLVCRVSYRNVMAHESKTFFIKPYKLFSHKDTMYLHAGLAKTPGKRYREPDFDPLLAVHRIQNIQLTDKSYVIPNNYDFERDFNQSFGVVKDDLFSVEILFSGWAAVDSHNQRKTIFGLN